MSGRGNLLGRVEKLKTLGARASKKHAEHLLAQADVDESPTLEDRRDQKESEEDTSE